MDHDRLLRIGTFSTLSRISVRMLRHYQEHGVIVPAWVDPLSGHRFYRPEQLATAQLAVQLRDAGFPVATIAQLLGSTAPSRIDAALSAQRVVLSQQREDLRGKLAALDRVSTALRGQTIMSTIDVTVAHLPEMTFASLRRTLPGYGDEGLLWQDLVPLAARSGAELAPDRISGATFHDPEYRETDVDVEVWMQVTAPFAPVAPLSCRHQPAQEIVTATLVGDYSQMPVVTGAIGAYLAEHQLRTGPMFNIYRVSPSQDPDPSAWVTDVCFPILGS